MKAKQTDSSWLTKTILEAEKRIDDNRVTARWLNTTESKFEQVTDRWRNNPEIPVSRLYELDALLAYAHHDPDQAVELLQLAAENLNEGRQLVSKSAKQWLQNRRLQDKAVMEAKFRSKNNKRKFIALGTIGIAVILLAIAVPRISDYYTLKNADPALLSLAQDAGMTRKGELAFLRTNPKLVSDSDMITDCSSVSANSSGFIVQGCYVPDQTDPTHGQIYLRQMSSDLYNLEVVTAAYEMLHVVYADLSTNSGTATALNQEIESNYSAINDSNLNSQIKEFAQTEPGDRDLELFSLLGTQYYDSLDGNLQNYYSPYLSDPSIEVTDNNQVDNLFTNDQNQLNQLQSTITTDDNLANTAYQDSVEWAYAGNQYEDDYNYNIYLKDIDAENSAIDQFNSILQTYNILVSEYNGQQYSSIQNISPKNQ